MLRSTQSLVATLPLLVLACSPPMQPPGDPGTGVPPTPYYPPADAGYVDPHQPQQPQQPQQPVPGSPLDQCAALNVVSPMAVAAPVDIVWIVDSSGSMREEADVVQSNINSFATAISAGGLDVHVVMIADPWFVTVPGPLGTNPAQFLSVPEEVGSEDALEILLYSYAQWSSFLRADSQLHFIVVTDDESYMPGTQFTTQFASTSGGRSFKFHSIVSPPGSSGGDSWGWGDGGCSGPNGGASANGDQYWALSASTGGGQYSICTTDWTNLFAQLQSAIAIPQPLPCVFDIPPPPAGQTFDANQVNVKVTFGTGAEQFIPNTQVFERCGTGGWYYDNPAAPTRVVLCPETCQANSADTSVRVDIAFGCATQLL